MKKKICECTEKVDKVLPKEQFQFKVKDDILWFTLQSQLWSLTKIILYLKLKLNMH